ncbi:hypothetical protein QYH69_21875 [Paraburkholderia sp. SARCC-3016]|uniref:hypothetical protein n=1 Tax=Paraburkholderia sp. SARCC-3016 TaxID=3058611 RepID=UPI002807A388|nr:hypothetical protein [Paraburkholderia sp. SARCC-3016]MDQ7979892.1 hypothetical protein [Paraburkholderia sp. SARCC-3016]
MTLPLTPREAARLADQAEALAYADFFAAAPTELRRRLRLSIEQIADATLLLAPGLPITILNRAIGLGLQHDARVEDVRNIAARFRDAGCQAWQLLWSPLARPQNLLSVLSAQGLDFHPVSNWAKMVRGADAPPEIASTLSAAPASAHDAEKAASVITEAFGLPPYVADWFLQLHGRPGWKLYSVKDGDAVVGGGSLFVAGELAWLGMGGVATSHRRRGGQGVLIARRIEGAIGLSARYIFTETGEPVDNEPSPSLNNMKRCGFRKILSRLNLVGSDHLMPSSNGAEKG